MAIHTCNRQPKTSKARTSQHRLRWRSADIAMAAVLGAASGVIYWGFDFAYPLISPLLGAILPGIASLIHAFWYFSGPLAMLIVRKPGSGLFVNLVASIIETLFGSSYSFTFTVIPAILQGIFSDLPFALFGYRRFNLPVNIASGSLTALEYGFFVLLFRFQGVALLSPRGITHMVCEVVGGTLIAGVMTWFLFRTIAKTGALDHFASGRAVHTQQLL